MHRPELNEPCTTTKILPTATRLANLLSDGENMAMDAMAVIAAVVMAQITMASVAILKV